MDKILLLYENYTYARIELIFEEMSKDDPNMTFTEYGDSFEIGNQFIVILGANTTLSFIMINYSVSDGAIYKLIYYE